MTEPQLKPCPFCGKKPTYSKHENTVWPECYCQQEGDAQLETWNNRPIEDKLLEACKGLLQFIDNFSVGDDWYKENYGAIKQAQAAIAAAEGAP